ncbi:MAG: ABC transporter substrate-binding protein [Candidatus Magasanikbacteria bacterium]
MSSNSKWVTVAVVALIVIIGLIYLPSGQNNSQSPQNPTIKVGGLPINQGLPFFLAFEKGYFQEAGLNVKWKKFEAPNRLVDALLSRKIDFTHTGGPLSIAAIAEFKHPGKLQIYEAACGNKEVPNDTILIRKDSDIETVQDLQGKKLGYLKGVQWKTVAKHILSEENLKPGEDVKLVGLPPSLQASSLSSGKIDALLAIEPVPTVVKEKGIGKTLVRVPTIKYLDNPFCGGAGIMSSEFAKNNPEATKKFLEVMDKAVEETNKNPDEARKYLKEYTPLKDKIISEVPVPVFKMYDDFSKEEIGAVNTFLGIFTKFDVVDGKMDFQEILYSQKQ